MKLSSSVQVTGSTGLDHMRAWVVRSCASRARIVLETHLTTIHVASRTVRMLGNHVAALPLELAILSRSTRASPRVA
eukprot:4666251-Prymnesium_polylepis.3